MDHIRISKDLLSFIQKSPSMYHTVLSIRSLLDEAGYSYYKEGDEWDIQKGTKFYTIRNNSSIVAINVGNQLQNMHFQMSATHGDSPTYKLKARPEINKPHNYLRLDVEGYGGVMDATWFDKPLSVAGRVLIKDEEGLKNRFVYIDKDILIIPSLAIHLNRDVNDGYKYNRQVDLCPLFSNGDMTSGAFNQMIADSIHVESEQIVSQDLYLVNRQQPTIWGYKDEFISSAKLDNLQCTYASLQAFIQSTNVDCINVFCCFDNEEIGSGTKQGAKSTFLSDTLHRVNYGLGFTKSHYYQAISKSFMVSCDNVHAVHPNHPEKTDEINHCFMNGGIVIKESAKQKYTSDGFSSAVIKELCSRAQVPSQVFANRSDSEGGSTLGNLSTMQVSLHSVDIGLPQLAMHSSYETAGTKDTQYLINLLKEYFSTNIYINGADDVRFK